MVSYQWSIFWAVLDPAEGSEQGGTLPVLVVSAEEVNQNLPVVTVLPLTSLKAGRRVYPTEVFLPGKNTGLPKDSIAMAHQIRIILKQRLSDRCGWIESNDMRTQILRAIDQLLGRPV